MNLYDTHGLRKYLTPQERHAFLQAAQSTNSVVFTFCATLLHTGCRISEALNIAAGQIDLGDGVIVIECLKKRKRGIFRAVPVPPQFLDDLDRVHDISGQHRNRDRGQGHRLWNWSRTTGWRRVREVMDRADISGLHATPKVLRHGFGVKAVVKSVPLNLTQKWLGHKDLSTTSIYAAVVGPEERSLAAQMWA